MYRDHYDATDYGYGYRSRPVCQREHLDPLLNRLKEYDELRMSLINRGGSFSRLEQLTDLLRQEIVIPVETVPKFSLIDQKALKSALDYFDNGDLVLDIRQQQYGFPIYYLCKVKNDYYNTYNSVVEDLYISPGYTFHDNRLVKLMDWGHQYLYLRLSLFRQQFMLACKDDPETNKINIDRELSRIGSQVLQYAWHEDQNLGIYVSEHFGLTNFRRAVELVYLCLTADLCELRANTDKVLLKFFDQVCYQPAIHGFLISLQNASDLPIVALQQKARNCYSRLLKTFNKLLTCNVAWGASRQPLPLYKLICANMFRLDIVWQEIVTNKEVHAVTGELEKLAAECIEEINAI